MAVALAALCAAGYGLAPLLNSGFAHEQQGRDLHAPPMVENHAGRNDEASVEASAGGRPQTQVWTCPMHPQVHRNGPGSCPICGMTLVQVGGAESVSHADQIHVAADQQHRLGLVTQSLSLTPLDAGTAIPGQVVIDESKVINVAPKVEGWVRRIGVTGPGQPIRRGQMLYEIYSPDLQQRQRDYLDLLTRRDALLAQSTGMGGVGNSAPEAMLASVARERFKTRQRLLAADIPEDIVDALDKDRRVREVVPVRAEHDGQLTSIQIHEGGFTTPTQIALSYNRSDAAQIELDFTADQLAALPGRFSAELVGTRQRISVSMDSRNALVDPQTRLARLRAPLDAHAIQVGLLPGSLVQARVTVSGKPVLAIPRDAILRSADGDFAVVDDGDNHFRRVKLDLGAEGRDKVEVRKGLVPGQAVVVNGQFLLGTEAAWQADRRRNSGEAMHHDE